VNRIEELRRAVRSARLPAAAVVMFDTLAQRADWATGVIPPRYQPRSLTELAGWAGLSRRHAANMLNVLERFGWLRRDRPPELRRGASTVYVLDHGRPRLAEVREPASDAERARRYRQRKRAGERCTPGVTDERHDDSALMKASRDRAPDACTGVHQSTVHNHVTKEQANGQVAQWAAVGGEVGKPEIRDSYPCQECDRRISPLMRAQTLTRLGRILCSRCAPDAFVNAGQTSA
jgi:DNA-binding MarR family transcriptional regulator